MSDQFEKFEIDDLDKLDKFVEKTPKSLDNWIYYCYAGSIILLILAGIAWLAS